MARYRQATEQTDTQSNSLQTAVERTKKDLVWMVIGIVLAVGCGLGIGNLFIF